MKRLIHFFEEKYKREEYAEIIRWGSALSKPLWLSHNIETRMSIGKYIEKAAPILGNNKVRTRALINDIGWTKVELLMYHEAEEIINKGIKLAEKETDYYMMAKGYRHLFGLYFRQGNNLKMAKQYLDKSFEIINTKLEEGTYKTEMTAEHYFAKALLECHNGEHNQALEDIKVAEEGYSNLKEKEWKIKIMARKGDIILASQKSNNIDDAIAIFKEGLVESREYQYLQQEVKNLRGLGACYTAKGKDYYDEAKKNLTRARKIAKKLSLHYEVGNIDKQISNLNNKQA